LSEFSARGGKARLPEGESYSLKDLAITLARMLGLEKNDVIEVQRNRLDPNRVMVIRHPGQEKPAN
jgi:hypothetical protein